jgi:hypothetical protein
MLRRSGSVDEFSKQFMALSCRDPSITEPQQIQLFITGLGDPLRTDVALQQPSTLDDAVIFARAYEQRNASRDTGQPQSARGGGRFANRTTTQPTAPSPTASAGSSTATNVKPASSVVRLSPTEIAQQRKDNMCFHCDELFTQGHKQQCKQLFVIEVLGDDDETDPPPLDTKPTISIAALTGIQPCKGRTMQVFVTIHGTVLRALLDSGSTHNFVDSEAAARAGIVFGTQAGLSVAVANGDHVSSSGCCNNLKIFIAGDEFIINCYGLALGSYDMVLGV